MSISEAAKKNYVTQSAVSQAIGKLEKQFDVKLIYYKKQQLYVTSEGMVVYEQAKHVFKSVQNTFDKMDQSKSKISDVLRFLTTKSLGTSILAPSYKRIQNEMPSVALKFKLGGLNIIRTRLKREEAEFAIVVYDHNFSEFEKVPIIKGRFHLYQAKGSPKNLIKNGIYVDEFEGPYVKELQKYFDDSGDTTLQIKHEVSGWDSVARFTDVGVGVGFFPDYLVSHNRYPNIEFHPQTLPDFEYEICAIHNKNEKLSKSALEFIEKLTMD